MAKTIAEHMRDVLAETGNTCVDRGDFSLLDMCADRCTHTKLMRMHPLDRHIRVLDALGKSPLFVKGYTSYPGYKGWGRVRAFWIKGHEPDYVKQQYELYGQAV